MKIYLLDSFHPGGVAYAAQRADIIRCDDPRARNWHEDADGVMVRVTRIGVDDMARARKLRVISKQGVGLDNIDLAAAKARGIAACRTPSVNKEAVAEMAPALALSVVRRVTEFDRRIRRRQGRTCGFPRHGQYRSPWSRANGAAAFDANIMAYDPYVPAERWSELPHRRVASLAEMLPDVDILSLHLPLPTESHDMIDSAALALMKPTAVMVNTSRGGIVNEAALHQAISSGTCSVRASTSSRPSRRRRTIR